MSGNHRRQVSSTMRTRLNLALLAFFAATLPNLATASVIRRAPLSDLVETSEWVVHARVRQVEDDLSTSDRGPFLTRYTLELVDVLKGADRGATTLELTVPGGKAGDRVMRIPGMPVLSRDSEVVLLLVRAPNGRLVFTGLGQGVFAIDRTGDRAKFVQSIEHTTLVDKGGAYQHASGTSGDLNDLLERLRSAIGGER